MPVCYLQSTEPFVVKRRGLGTTKTALYLGTLLFGLMVLLITLVVIQSIRGGPIREPLEAVWLSWGGMPLIFAVGLPILLLVGAVTAFEERRESDDDDVLLTPSTTSLPGRRAAADDPVVRCTACAGSSVTTTTARASPGIRT